MNQPINPKIMFAKMIIGEENYNWLDRQSQESIFEFAMSSDGKATIQLVVDELKKFMAAKAMR